MVSHLIGSYSYKQVEEPLFFPTNGNNLQKEGVRLVINLLVITHLLKYADLGRLRQVNRSWNLLILSSPKFVNKMLVSSLLFAARQTAKKVYEERRNNLLLLKSLKIEIQHDFIRAQKSVKSWDFYFKIGALLELVKADPKHNFTPVKTFVLTECNPYCRAENLQHIVELEADYNLIDAKVTAQAINPKVTFPLIGKSPGIFQRSYKAQALLKIIQVEARSNLDDAKATAQTLTNPRDFADAMSEIVKIEAQSNLEAAEATAQTIPIKDRWKASREILKKIGVIKEDAQANLAAAKVELDVQIIEAEALTDLSSANAKTLAIQDPWMMATVILKIAKVVLRNPKVANEHLMEEDPQNASDALQ